MGINKTTLLVLAVAVLGLFALTGCEKSFSQEEVNSMIADAQNNVISQYDQKLLSYQEQVKSEVDKLAQESLAVQEQNKQLVAEKEQLALQNKEISDKLSAIEQEVKESKPVNQSSVVVEVSGYTHDEKDLVLGNKYDFLYTDRQLGNLFDDKVYFDGNYYDAEESYSVDDLELGINKVDFKENSYAILPTSGVKYLFTVENSLNVSKISSDQPLEIEFLGEDIKIIDWDSNKITLVKGKEYTMNMGDKLVLEDKELSLDIAYDDFVYVSVKDKDGSESAKIFEGNTKKINDLEIRVESVIGVNGEKGIARFSIGKDVLVERLNGERLDDESIWDYVVSANSFGIELNTDLNDLTSEYKALKYGDKLCLPNDYVCLNFVGLDSEKEEVFYFEPKVRNAQNFLEGRGKFVSGLKEYSLVFINASGIYDDEFVLINSASLGLGDSELALNLTVSGILIDNVEFDYPVSYVKVGSVDISGKEDNYRNVYGIVVSSPKDYLEDNRVKLVVPKEQLNAKVSFFGK